MEIDSLIKAQENILYFLMEGPKGRDDFWEDIRFKESPTHSRGIYPRKNLKLLYDTETIEKFYVSGRVKWKIKDGAYFRLSDGSEVTWDSSEPHEIPEIIPELEILEKVEYPYLDAASLALKNDTKWYKKWFKN